LKNGLLACTPNLRFDHARAFFGGPLGYRGSVAPIFRVAAVCAAAAAFAASETFAQDAVAERDGAWALLRAEAPPDSAFVASVAAAIEANGALIVPRAAALETDEGVHVDRLRALASIERAIVTAREEAARLDESDALARLTRARTAIADLGDVPGVARFAAEVELAIGLVAAQAGRRALAEQSLRAAVALDATREIGAAEAPPDVVAIADRLRREVATGPRGHFAIRVEGGVVAEVYLDDRRVGAAPTTIEAPVGRHVVRVEARGHRSYARFVDVFEGERTPWSVALAPTRRHTSLQRLDDATDAGDLRAVRDALGAIDEPARVVFLFASNARAFVVVCVDDRCEGPSRVEDDGALAAARPARDDALRRARDEANRPTRALVTETPRARRSVRRGVPPAVAAVAAGVAAAIVVARSGADGPRSPSVHVDGSALLSP
jgi:hypothetical protein